MSIGYVAVETFFPTNAYKEWSKLFHIKQVVSLDCALCPSILVEEVKDNYRYLQESDFYNDVLNDLNLLLDKVKGKKDIQILAVLRNPKSDCVNIFKDTRFRLYGYDLLEDFTRISALTNCGGFNKAFLPKDITEYGLIKEFDKAKQIQLLLANEYPNEEHAECSLWAVWKMEFYT